MPMLMPLYIMESVNLVVTDAPVTATSPGIQTYLQLISLKLPGLEENYLDWRPGGSPVQMEVAVWINKLEASFKLAGWNPEILKVFGKGDEQQRFTAHGLVREKRTSVPWKAMAILEGRLGKIEPSTFRKGDLFGHDYAIRGVTHYELWFGHPRGTLQRIYDWDFFVNEFKTDEQNIHNDLFNRI